MEYFAVILALSASFIWATASLVAFKPVKHFGTFEFVRIQLPTATILLVIVVTLMGTWQTINWSYWPNLLLSGFVGILLGDLTLHKCLQHGGPRRMQILFSLNAPMVTVLGYFFFSEALTHAEAVGFLLVLAGVITAIWLTPSEDGRNQLEAIHGSIWGVVFWGVAAALCQAIGLLAMKPVIESGVDPLAASAVRTGGSAFLILCTFLLPQFQSFNKFKGHSALTLQTVIAGWMGYVLAMSLLLFALRYSSTGIVAVMGSTVPIMMLPISWLVTGIRPPIVAWIAALIVVIGTAVIIN